MFEKPFTSLRWGGKKQVVTVLLALLIFLLIFLTPQSAQAISFSSWSFETVQSSVVVETTSLAVDSSDNPHLTYLEGPLFTGRKIFYATKSGTWTTETAVDLTTYPATFFAVTEATIAVTSSNVPKIAYSYVDDDFLSETDYRVATRTGPSTWGDTFIYAPFDTVLFDTDMSIAIDSSDTEKVAFRYDDSNFDSNPSPTKMRFWNGGSSIVVDATDGVGKDSSIALDSSDNPQISHHNQSTGTLLLTSFNGSSWSTQTVDSTVADVGEFTSIDLDSSGNAHISYYDATNTALKYASFNGSTWTLETVDNSAAVGKYTSLKLDSSGRPFISYYDESTGDLKLAFKDGSWTTQTLISTNNVGFYSSLGLDSGGNVYISYFDDTANAVEVAFGTLSTANTAAGTNITSTFDSSNSYLGDNTTLLASSGDIAITYDQVNTEGTTAVAFGEANLNATALASFLAADWNFFPIATDGPGIAYEFSKADGLDFDPGVTLTVKVNPAVTLFGLGVNDLVGAYLKSDGSFEVITGTYNPGNQTFSFNVPTGTFSGFGVAVNPEPTTILLLGSALLGLLPARKKFFRR